MAVKVELSYAEHPKAIDKKGNYTSIEVQYLVFGVTTEEEALTAVHGKAPAESKGLPLDSIEIDTRETNDTFRVNAIYREEEVDVGDSGGDDDDETPTESFDCGGGTKHLLYSFGQKKVYGDKDAGGAIGWNGKSGDDCEIAGVDVPTAQLRETYTKPMRVSKLTTAFKRKVAALVGKVNSGSFKGWNAGEVMFLGMSYSTPAKKAKKVTVTFNFAIQPNESGVRIAGKSVTKKGFEYVWAISKTVASSGSPKLEVEGIYVDQVCEYASFSGLGL
ncbi:MAG: hypothetical protein IKX19_08025 [Clostridia bacterium]|nr:hypothetical protein [Clostridia bacterium]